jgi:hypothetical protein
MDMTVERGTAVGIAKNEFALTSSLVRLRNEVLPPGRGYRTVAIDEVELGVGRPDVLLAAISVADLRRWIRDIRPSEARLAEVSINHFRSISRRFDQSAAKHVRRLQNPTRESLLIEAKLSDWRSGIAQLAPARRYFSRTALLVPVRVAPRVPTQLLRSQRIGLLSIDGMKLVWHRRAVASSNSLAYGLSPRPSAIRRLSNAEEMADS